jgi:predicted DNA-binding protein (MmcQ/YjbR family)
MVTLKTLRALALSFPETIEEPHFDKTSFRVKKKIFATFDESNNIACIKLSEIDQDVFAKVASKTIYPVDNKWGKQGWTNIELNKVNDDLFIDVLTTAYCNVATKKLAKQVRPNDNE